MNWLSIGKGVLGLIVGHGVNNIVGNIISATTPKNLNTFNKITTTVGSLVLSAMIADKAIEYMNGEIDSLLHIQPEEKKVEPESVAVNA